MTYRLELELPGYKVIVYERAEYGEFDWELREARRYDDQDTFRTYRKAAIDYNARLGSNANFNHASRVSVGGFDVGPAPTDDKDQPAWDAYNAAEVVAMMSAIADVAPALAAHGIHLSAEAEDYAPSRYAICITCAGCSPALVYREPILYGGQGNPLNFSIDVMPEG